MTMMIKNTLSTLEYNLNDDIIWTFDTGDFEYITCNKDSLANYRQEKGNSQIHKTIQPENLKEVEHTKES